MNSFMYMIGYDKDFKKMCNTGWGCGFMVDRMQEKPAEVKKDLKITVKEYIKEVYDRADVYKRYNNIDVYIRMYNLATELDNLVRGGSEKSALTQTENRKISKYP